MQHPESFNYFGPPAAPPAVPDLGGLPRRARLDLSHGGAPEEFSMETVVEAGRRTTGNAPRHVATVALEKTVANMSPVELDRFMDHPEESPEALAARNEAYRSDAGSAAWLTKRQRTLPRTPADAPQARYERPFDWFAGNHNPDFYSLASAPAKDLSMRRPTGDIVDAELVVPRPAPHHPVAEQTRLLRTVGQPPETQQPGRRRSKPGSLYVSSTRSGGPTAPSRHRRTPSPSAPAPTRPGRGRHAATRPSVTQRLANAGRSVVQRLKGNRAKH